MNYYTLHYSEVRHNWLPELESLAAGAEALFTQESDLFFLTTWICHLRYDTSIFSLATDTCHPSLALFPSCLFCFITTDELTPHCYNSSLSILLYVSKNIFHFLHIGIKYCAIDINPLHKMITVMHHASRTIADCLYL